MNFEMREHQVLGVDMIKSSIRSGKKRPILAAPTSYGKTIVAAHILKACQDKGNKGFFICDRIQLTNQTIEKFKQFGIDFGVRQSNHDLSNPRAPIQIATMQTLAAYVKNGRGLPEMDLAIVDEAHTQYKVLKELCATYNNIPIIGMTATPYSQGLGLVFNNLLMPITPKSLLNKGFLCPVKYYGGVSVDSNDLKSAGKNSFTNKSVINAVEKDQDKITGDIILNWIKWGENSQTVAFSPSQAQSRFMVELFNKAGVSAVHIDCGMTSETREEIIKSHDRGEFKILSCAKLLNTGYDSPTTRVIIDCYPVKSLTTYVQRVGRIMRTAPGKEYAIYLDHAGNFDRFGFQHEIVPYELSTKEKGESETDLIQERKKAGQGIDCPQCSQKMAGITCHACGYQIPITEQILTDGTMLEEKGAKKDTFLTKNATPAQKLQAYAELVFYAKNSGRQIGWAAHLFKDIHGHWPAKKQGVEPIKTGEDVLKKITSRNIKYAKWKERND